MGKARKTVRQGSFSRRGRSDSGVKAGGKGGERGSARHGRRYRPARVAWGQVARLLWALMQFWMSSGSQDHLRPVDGSPDASVVAVRRT